MKEHVEAADHKSVESLIPEGVLPGYLATAFGELYEEDGLIIMAKGLGWLSLLASFARFYADVEQGHLAVLQEHDLQAKERSKPPLVLVLGLKDAEHEVLTSILESWGTPHAMMPKSITNESGQGKDRIGECAKLDEEIPSDKSFRLILYATFQNFDQRNMEKEVYFV